ncbi:UDP-2,3-diacylglucosamine diphosphatase LpxI [Magnetovibrio sp. PR-2]|uniref:LpxI family protein n=1 Tax=Magnetovibrio sp. PR-2 TaxID=3120356 RepID=UPI002FCE30A6
MPTDPGPLGIVAGRGELPRLLIRSCREQGRDVFVIALKDHCDPETVDGVNHAWVRIGAGGTSISELRKAGVRDLVMAGAVKRPGFWSVLPDWRTFKFFLGGWLSKGDDGLLRAIVRTLETQEGFRIRGAHQVRPELLSPEGVLGRVQPSAKDDRSIQTAVRAAKDLGAQDKGQAAVGRADDVIALEGPDGTDAMLTQLIASGEALGAVLAKMTKPGQETRVDLPTIGLRTVENVKRAGMRGIVVEAGSSIIVDRDQVLAKADALDVFVVGMKP